MSSNGIKNYNNNYCNSIVRKR